MSKKNPFLTAALAIGLVAALFSPSCETKGAAGGGFEAAATSLDDPIPLHPTQKNRLAEVMKSKFCAKCHPVIYAEHEQNTHGRAFTDPEPRLATGRFAHGDCIRCHTPRPVFETGTGMNPMRRHHNLVEGNTCMTCHWKPERDYESFEGGAECKTAFDDRVGTVEACAACHRNHGTPYQWEKAPTGKAAGRTCMTCHMQTVYRPVAVGSKPRAVKSHVFPGARNEAQLRRAYDYQVKVDGSEVVVKVTNKGAGHNFPTELKQRALESLVIVRDADGAEQYRSRMVFRDPYKRPYGLMLLVNTQIPPGQSREHRVPLKIANGKIDTELHFKLYFPIEDNHPDLARRLESRRVLFENVTPSTRNVDTAPEPGVVVPANVNIREASPGNLVDFKRPAIGKTAVEIPKGSSKQDIARLIELFQFPVPEAQKRAVARAAEIGKPAVPALIEALGSWDNKTWKSAIKALVKMGAPARAAVQKALTHEALYVRVHARQVVVEMDWQGSFGDISKPLIAGLTMQNAVDRASAAEALGRLRLASAIEGLRENLFDEGPDVVRAAALALAQLGDKGSVGEIERALRRAPYIETRRDLARALAMLGSTAGIPLLIEGLEVQDDLLRESFFEALFEVTGIHMGYDPLAPRLPRLEAIARIRNEWAKRGSGKRLRRMLPPSARTNARAWHLVQRLGGGAGIIPGADDGNDEPLVRQLVAAGEDSVPALILGLKFPYGFADKRYRICQALGQIGSKQSVPALVATLRDPVTLVAAAACNALGNTGDEEALWGIDRYNRRLLTLIQQDKLPKGENAPSADFLLAQAARTRLRLDEKLAKADLVRLLLSEDLQARTIAIDALAEKFGDKRGYDPEASADARRKAADRWR